MLSRCWRSLFIVLGFWLVGLVALEPCTARATVSAVFVSSTENASEPILSSRGFVAYGVGIPVVAGRIEVDGTARVQLGDPVTGVPGASWSSLTMQSFSDSGGGDLFFCGFLSGTSPDEDLACAVHGSGANSLLVLQRGVTEAPGTPSGVFFTGASSGRINTVGQVAFRGGLIGTGVDCTPSSPGYNCEGIWAGDPSALQLVVRVGDPAIGVPDATYYSFGNVGRNSLAFNQHGQITFVAKIRGATVGSGNDTAIYRGSPSSIVLVAREGQPAPGGGTYGDLHEPSISETGNGVVFLAGGAIYTHDHRVVAVGDAAPRGGLFEELFHPAISANVAFRARVGASLLDTYVVSTSEGLVEAVREGDVAPGTGGETFTALYSNAVINLGDQIPFVAKISDGRKGIWVFHMDGSGALVVLDGDPSPVGPDYSGIFGGIADGAARENISDGGFRYFDRSGRVTFRSSLADGSDGLFVSDSPTGVSSSPVFTDDFESGDTLAWAVTAP
ncbi:MAG: hypothetical protein K8R59_15890 [Thermoanaerobaculales bacterium]|nr:hypothetical protein [Thermoanaerobaculales bacterium]